MNTTTFGADDRENRIKSQQELLQQLEKDLQSLRTMHRNLREIQARFKRLNTYYQTDWLQDYEEYKGEKYYKILGQDTIYNILIDIEIQQKNIIKRLVANL